MTANLRFAPIIRVSTERQEKQGESLETQKKQINEAVKILGGTIPKALMDKYSGQEHATPDFERKKLDKLLEDCTNGIFDAVIVADVSRFSRDNLRSEEAVRVFLDNKIRFFGLTQEYDLFSPDQRLFVSLASTINQYQASSAAMKSVLNKIERAKRGIPVVRMRPHARLYDEKTGKWSLDSEKALKIQRAAKLFLSGESLNKSAQSISMQTPTLRKIFLQQCGETWTQKFDVPRFNIKQEIKVKIPPLLTDEQTEAIKARFKQSRQIYRKHSKHPFLLSGMVICDTCWTPYYSSHKQYKTGKSYDYYVHDYKKDRPNHGCCNREGHCIKSEDLENAVMLNVYRLLGDQVRIHKAIENAAPNKKKLEKLEKHRQSLQKDLTKASKGRENLVRAISKGIISDSVAANRSNELNERIDTIEMELEKINEQLRSIPSREQIKAESKKILGLKERYFSTQYHFNRMSFEDKRALLQMLFTQSKILDRRYGIYLKHNSKKGRNWTFRIEGNFVKLTSSVPTSKVEWEHYARRVLGLSQSDKLIIQSVPGHEKTDSQNDKPIPS